MNRTVDIKQTEDKVFKIFLKAKDTNFLKSMEKNVDALTKKQATMLQDELLDRLGNYR